MVAGVLEECLGGVVPELKKMKKKMRVGGSRCKSWGKREEGIHTCS